MVGLSPQETLELVRLEARQFGEDKTSPRNINSKDEKRYNDLMHKVQLALPVWFAGGFHFNKTSRHAH